MSTLMDEEIKRWTAKRKSALVVEIIQGKTTIAEASRAYDLSPSEIESWIEDGRRAWSLVGAIALGEGEVFQRSAKNQNA